MHRRNFLFLCAGATVLGWTGWRWRSTAALDSLVAQGALAKVFRRGQALGTRVLITAYHADPGAANRGIEAALAAIERVENLMSLFRPESQLSRLNRTGCIERPDPDLVRVLRYAAELSERTGGAFDVTVQPLWFCYQKAAGHGRLPTEAEIASALASVDWRDLQVTDDALRLARPGMAVTLNGIAQGFAADVAAAALRAHGIEHALIDSGEFGVVGAKPAQGDWQIGIKHPREERELLGLSAVRGRCLATSGDYETVFSPDRRYNHIFDPHTGRSPGELASVSVLAPTAMEADGLSTALFLVGCEQGERLLDEFPGADALFVDKAGCVRRTPNFPFEPMT